MSDQLKHQIQQVLQQFQQTDLKASGLNLLATLGYESQRQSRLSNKSQDFLAHLIPGSS